MNQRIPWWALLVAVIALSIGAALVLVGKATTAEAASFVAPVFALLTALYVSQRQPPPE